MPDFTDDQIRAAIPAFKELQEEFTLWLQYTDVSYHYPNKSSYLKLEQLYNEDTSKVTPKLQKNELVDAMADLIVTAFGTYGAFGDGTLDVTTVYEPIKQMAILLDVDKELRAKLTERRRERTGTQWEIRITAQTKRYYTNPGFLWLILDGVTTFNNTYIDPIIATKVYENGTFGIHVNKFKAQQLASIISSTYPNIETKLVIEEGVSTSIIPIRDEIIKIDRPENTLSPNTAPTILDFLQSGTAGAEFKLKQSCYEQTRAFYEIMFQQHNSPSMNNKSCQHFRTKHHR
jgi:hypothetical protein